MAMTGAKLRAPRFRLGDVDARILPPPLPLINLPDEVRLACTGVPGVRPTHLPVRHHIIESYNSSSNGNTDNSGNTPIKQMREPEPILRESRMRIESETEELKAREVVKRVHVYEYNQPQVHQNNSVDDKDDKNDTLVFDSLFESGNLQRAERIFRRESANAAAKYHEYELLIHPDIKNSAYRQWFYFEVRNGKPGITYKFALTNLAKSGALFGCGLQPVVYSDIDAETRGIGWVHRGTHVRYDASLAVDSAPGSTCLSFQYEFTHAHDRVYFACIQPYTYTDLNEYLEKLERDPERAAVCRRTELCQSIAGNTCDLLSITASTKDGGTPPDEKRVIVISARVHPGEPNSSWMMKGMLDYLTGASSGAQVLRQHFVFKIVPMLNPDGVINGNTRVSLAGWDLNRKWSCPVEKLFPTVFHLKRQLATLQARDRVAIYCDLHGHSLNRNVFTYGCYNKKSKRLSLGSSMSNVTLTSTYGGSGNSTATAAAAPPRSHLRASVKNDPRVFPMIVAKHSRFFSFTSCDFKVHASKRNTARVVVNHELGVINSYTLEASFCGPDTGPRKDTQFATWDLEEMGQSWCQSLLIYFDLVADFHALDARLRLQQSQQHSVSDAPLDTQQLVSSSSHNSSDAIDPASSLLVASLPLSIPHSLLDDCEAAISALMASGMSGGNECDGDGSAIAAMDSDLSDAEDEPIPPNHVADEASGHSNDRFVRHKSSEPADRGASSTSDNDSDKAERSSGGGSGRRASSRRKARGGVGRKALMLKKRTTKRSKSLTANKTDNVQRTPAAVDGVTVAMRQVDSSSAEQQQQQQRESDSAAAVQASSAALTAGRTRTTRTKIKKASAKHHRQMKSSSKKNKANAARHNATHAAATSDASSSSPSLSESEAVRATLLSNDAVISSVVDVLALPRGASTHEPID